MTGKVTLKGKIETIKPKVSGNNKPYTMIVLKTLTDVKFVNVWGAGIKGIVEEGDFAEFVCTKTESQGKVFYNYESAKKLSEEEQEALEAAATPEPPEPESEQDVPVDTVRPLTTQESIVRQTMFKCAAEVSEVGVVSAKTLANYAFKLEKRFYEGPKTD